MKVTVKLLPNSSDIDLECDSSDTVQMIKSRIINAHFDLYKKFCPDCEQTSLVMFYKPGVSFGRLRDHITLGEAKVLDGDVLEFDWAESTLQETLKKQKEESPPFD